MLETENFLKNQISKQKTYYMSENELKFFRFFSDFELKTLNTSDFEFRISQRDRFRVKKFTTRQILNQVFCNVSDLELNIF